MSAIKFKPLGWKGPAQKALVAEPFPGFKYTILDDERGVDWSVSSDEIGWNPVGSVDDAKRACGDDFQARLLSIFECRELPKCIRSGDLEAWIFSHPDKDERMERARLELYAFRAALKADDVEGEMMREDRNV